MFAAIVAAVSLTCAYIGPAGDEHVTHVSGAVAVQCSNGARVPLGPSLRFETGASDPHTSLFVQGIDLGTTIAGIGAGFSEVNPVLAPFTANPAGFLLIAGAKFGAVNYFRSLPQPECETWLGASTSLIGGVGLANGVLLAGVTQGVSLAIGAAAVPVIDYFTEDWTRRECLAGPFIFHSKPALERVIDNR